MPTCNQNQFEPDKELLSIKNSSLIQLVILEHVRTPANAGVLGQTKMHINKMIGKYYGKAIGTWTNICQDIIMLSRIDQDRSNQYRTHLRAVKKADAREVYEDFYIMFLIHYLSLSKIGRTYP